MNHIIMTSVLYDMLKMTFLPWLCVRNMVWHLCTDCVWKASGSAGFGYMPSIGETPIIGVLEVMLAVRLNVCIA